MVKAWAKREAQVSAMIDVGMVPIFMALWAKLCPRLQQ
jgi:hypothetical protein